MLGGMLCVPQKTPVGFLYNRSLFGITQWKRNSLTLSNFRLRTWKPVRRNYGGIFDFDAKQTRLSELSRLTEDPAIWDDNKRAQELGREKKALEDVVIGLRTVTRQLNDARDLFQMAKEEDDDPALLSIQRDLANVEKTVADMEFRRM